MARTSDRRIEHLLRRAGFGARPDELDYYGEMSFGAGRRRALDYESIADDVDDLHRKPGYVGITTRGQFPPQSNITDARQRWLFRMVHSEPAAPGEDDALLAQPLRDRLHEDRRRRWAPPKATRYMAAKPSEDPGGVRGQIEMLRDNALGNFRDILRQHRQGHGDARSGSTADTNTRAQPQENFGREIMELFTMGVGHYTEADVYAGGARVHRLEPGAARAPRPTARSTTSSSTTPAQHDTGAKTFSFPIYADGSQTIPARAGRRRHAGRPRSHQRAGGEPEHRRATWRRKLYRFFVSEFGRRSTTSFVERIASVYLQQPLRHEGGDARGAAVAASSGTRAPTSRATPGRWSSSSAR